MTSPTKQPVHTDSIHTNAIHSDFIHSELLHAKAKQRRLHLWLSIGLLCSTLLLVGLIVLSNATTIDVFPKKAKDSASINIVNSIAFSIDNVIYSLQNNPTIEIHATGFQALRKTLLDHETGHTLRIELTEQTQSLQITTTPQTDQTRWFMDNTLVNIAAAFKQQLLSGQYHIGIDNPYYQTKNISIDMKLGQALQRHVQLENISGSLTIHSQPRADIQINGQPLGLTPITLQRTGGFYHLKITHADYQTITEDVEITNSKLNITRDYRLLPKPAFLHISLSPGGGVLLLNGKAVDGKDLNRKTKLPIKLAIPALRDNTLSYFKPGYFSQQKHINIPSGSEQHIAFHLKAKTGIVYIRSKPTRDTAPATMRNSAGIMLKRFNPNTSFVMGAPRHEQGQRANESQVSTAWPMVIVCRLKPNGNGWPEKQVKTNRVNSAGVMPPPFLPRQAILPMNMPKAAPHIMCPIIAMLMPGSHRSAVIRLKSQVINTVAPSPACA